MSLALKTNWSDQTLNLRCLGSLGFSLFLWELPLDDVLANVVFFREIVELSDLADTLRTQSARNGVVGESGDVLISFLDDDQVEYAEVAVHDTATNRSSFSLSLATWSKARVSLLEKQLNTAVTENALLHWKALFVIATRYANNVTL